MIAGQQKMSLIGVVSVLVVLALLSIFGSSLLIHLQGITKPDAATLWLSRIMFWIVAGLLWFYTVTIEKKKLLVWEENKYSWLHCIWHVFLIIVVIFSVMIPVSVVLQFLVETRTSAKLMEIKSFIQASKPLLLFVVVTAGVTEEIIFRGYLQPRFEALTKNPFWAIFVTSALFACLHIGYGTIQNVVGPFVIGLVFSTYYWKFRNLKVLIACHILIDLIAMAALLHKH